MEHGRTDIRIDANHVTIRFETPEQIVDRAGLCQCQHLLRLCAHSIKEEFLSWLRGAPVHQPGVTRLDPAHLLTGDMVFHQPDADIHRRLSSAQYAISIIVVGV